MGRASALPISENAMKKIIYIPVVTVLVGVMAFSGYKLYQGLHEYDVIDEYIADAEKYVTTPAPTSTPSKAATSTKKPEALSSVEEIEESLVEEDQVEQAPIAIDFTALLADAPDAIGWLYAPDGTINLPVVQGEDNLYYLKHLPDGNYSSGGSLFLDYLNEADFSDEASFIYGHNMKNGTMLQPLLDYKNQTYYDENPVLYLLTPEKNYKMELFAGILTDLESDVYTFSFDTPEIKRQFIDDLISRSTFTPSITPTSEDRLLCLSTCAYDFQDARYVVFGRLVEIG